MLTGLQSIRQLVPNTQLLLVIYDSTKYPHKGETAMSLINKDRESTTRRGFIKEVAVGAAGVAAAAGSLGASEAASAPIAQARKGSKYGNLVKSIPYQYWQGPYRQLAAMNGNFLNNEIHVQFGTPAVAGIIGTDTPEVHDFDQVMIFMGSDPTNLGDLGAEIEFCIGPEKEPHMVTASQAVFIPKGLAHLPATILRMDRRFIVMTISHARELRATPAPAAAKEYTGEPVGFMSKSQYRTNFPTMLWERKSAWHYGSRNRDDAGGYITSISNRDIGFSMLCEGINKGPYRFGDPYKPHVHNYDEFLICMGADCNDLGPLGGEIVFDMGEEMEPHTFTTSTVVMPPAKLPHCPEVVTRVDKPFIFIVLHAFGQPQAPAKKEA